MGFFSEDAGPGSDVWTVSELNSYIRELFEIDYRLQDVEVTGEISNFTQARSGHLYFTLKDEGSQLKCVMWRSAAEKLRFQPENGDAVSIHGRLSVYEAGGNYQLYADRIVPEGRGGLADAFERLKQSLAAEGLFDQSHKKPIPTFPKKIGVATSADAAALRDILNVLQRRYPLVSVLIAPTLVQGVEAPAQIIRSLQWLDAREDIDTIIIARGGGSMEDLWAFNDEKVARAIFAASHPVICGVGHETDFTIADFVADQRAPTPSVAAELAVPDIEEVRSLVRQFRAKTAAFTEALVSREKWRLQGLVRALGHLSPRSSLDNNRQRIDALSRRVDRAVAFKLRDARGVLAVTRARLTAISPLATLARGYAIVRDKDGRIVRTVKAVTAGEEIKIQITDGQFGATVS